MVRFGRSRRSNFDGPLIPRHGIVWSGDCFSRSADGRFIEWINEVYVSRSEELVFDEDRGRRRFVLQDIERKRNQFVTVTLRKICDRSDQTCARTAQFCPRFTEGVLTHDGALLRSAGFFKGAECGEGADVVDRADERAPRAASTEIFAEDIEHLLKVAAAIETDERRFHDLGQLGAKAVDEAGEAQFKQRACDRKFDENELLDFAVPVFTCPTAKSAAANEAGLVIVGAEVGGAGVGHLNRNDGDIGGEELGCDDRRDALIGLEFEDEVDAFADENVCVTQCFARAIAIVERDQLDVFAGGGGNHAARDFACELCVALRSKADAEWARGDGAEAVAIDACADALDEAAMDQSAQKPESGCLGQAGALHYSGERQFLTEVTKSL